MRSPQKTSPSRNGNWTLIESPTVPDWEAAHVFLEVARSGSFRAAALKLRQSVNALRRRVDALEKDLGTPLLLRNVNGVRLTDEGSKIFNAALHMESVSFELLRARNSSEKQVEGEVLLSITEGLGAYWLLPRLAEYQNVNPKLTLNLRCTQKPPDLLRLEADVSVQLLRPEEPDLKVMKLGYLHMMFFAAQSYVDIHGCPKAISELDKHRLVILTDDQGSWEPLYQKALAGISPTGHVALRNNISSAHFWAIVNGAGIGLLPSYVQALGSNLVPLDITAVHKHEIWLTYRSDAKRIARIRRTIDWIVRSFDPGRFPWFREEFIHPSRFAELYKGGPLPGMLPNAQA
jgi:DNA-binding transcriptional LysR family regulator